LPVATLVIVALLVVSMTVAQTGATVSHPLGRFGLMSNHVAPATMRITFEVVLKPRDEAALIASAFARAGARPGTYLSPAQFGLRWAPPPAAVDLVTDYFQDYGLSTAARWPGGLVLPVSGTVAQASSALGVHFDVARLSNGRVVVVADRYPKLPNALSDEIVGVTGLFANGYFPVTPKVVGTNVRSSCSDLLGANSPHLGYSPASVARYYHLPRFDRARPVTVGVAEFADVDTARTTPLGRSIETDAHCLGVGVHLQVQRVNGGSTNTSHRHLEEAALDIETLLSDAPGVHLIVYTASSGDADALYLRMVSKDQASVLLTTWGSCEADTPAQQLRIEQIAFAQAALQGQTVIAASGDDGSSDCLATDGGDRLAVDDPASQPLVTAVGGEQFVTPLGPDARPAVYNSAIYAGASGGGVSSFFGAPPYQHQVEGELRRQVGRLCPLKGGCRLVPDVAMIAVGARIDVPETGWSLLGGTSLAASVFAAGVADVESAVGTRLGLLNPWLYRLDADGQVFHPVRRGGNDFRHLHPGDFRATGSYSLATGLGTPNFADLLRALGQRLDPPPASWVRTRDDFHLRELTDAS